jgi:CO/xanthine dehydrogenase FAD-binding subunit
LFAPILCAKFYGAVAADERNCEEGRRNRLHPFEYVAPKSLKEAVGLLQQTGARGRILSGGTDLIAQVREDRRELDLMIDVKHIPELLELTHDPVQGLTVGAAVPCQRIYENSSVCRAYPGLIDAAELIGGIQIQSRASFGGNLCNASPAADSIPAMIAHYAVCRIAGPEGTRAIPVESFCTGPGKNVLKPNELLVSLHFPPPPANFGASYLRFIPRNEMDIAVAGCGVSVQLSPDGSSYARARLALGAVAPTPLLVETAAAELIGKEPTENTINKAALQAQSVARPITDMRGPAEYRRHLVGVLTRRALGKATERARAAVS